MDDMRGTRELCRVKRWVVVRYGDSYVCEFMFVDDGDLRVRLLTSEGAALVDQRHHTPHEANTCAEELLQRFLQQGWSLVEGQLPSTPISTGGRTDAA